MNMKKLITLLFTGLTALLTACSSYSDTSVLPVKIYNHTSKAINFNMTDATKKDWKGWELGYGGGGYGVSAYDSASGSGWRVPKKWDPNYTIFFQWAGNDEIYTKPKRAFVKLPKYKDEEKIYLAIHFFPNDNIKAFVTNMTPNYSDYPFGWPQDDDPKRKKKIGKRHAVE